MRRLVSFSQFQESICLSQNNKFLSIAQLDKMLHVPTQRLVPIALTTDMRHPSSKHLF